MGTIAVPFRKAIRARFRRRGLVTLSFSSFAQQARLRPQKQPCFPGILRGGLQLSGAPPIPARARRLPGRHSWPRPGLPCRIADRRIVGTATCRGIGCQGSRGRSGGAPQARSNPHRRGAKSVPVSFARLERESRLLVVGRTSPYPQARLLAGADSGRGGLARCSAPVEALALEAEAAFGYLGFTRIGFHSVDPDVRGAIGADVSRPAHLKLAPMPAAFLQVAAGQICSHSEYSSCHSILVCRAVSRCSRKRRKSLSSFVVMLAGRHQSIP